MKNKILKKIMEKALKILTKEFGSDVIHEKTDDSCIFLVHLPNEAILRVRIDEIKL